MDNGSVSERIAQMVEHFHKGNKSAFAKAVGISNQSLGEIVGARQSAPSFAALQKMLTAFPEVRMEWLIMGKGTMLPPPPTEWTDPFADTGTAGKEKSNFFSSSAFLIHYEESKKRREKEWEEYNAAIEQQKQERSVIKAVFERLAEKDPSIRKIMDTLPSAFDEIIDPDRMEQLMDAQHEEWRDQAQAEERAEWERQRQEREDKQ